VVLTRRDFLRLSGIAGVTALAGGAFELNRVIAQDYPGTTPTSPYNGLVNLIGDIHAHTNFSDGDESPDFGLRYARDVSKLDFACITDHAEIMTDDGLRILPYYQSLPAKYDDPGKFCVLYGFEWTGYHLGHAHRCVYTLDKCIPILPSNRPDWYTPEGLWKSLANYDCFCVPHTVVKDQTASWWVNSNPEMEPIAEFYSKWGCSLNPGTVRPLADCNSSLTIFNAFAAGKRYGLICNSDTHFTRPGSNLMEIRPQALLYPQAGLTGVWATAHTREAIYQALKSRCCYGMTGTRVNIQFTLNDAKMGSEIKSSVFPIIKYKISSSFNIAWVRIYKVSRSIVEELNTTSPGLQELDGTYTDSTFNADSSYFLKIDLANDDFAVTSPIWVTKT
jgi:hypothetical protein